MARRTRKQPLESVYGRKYNDFNNPTGGPGPVTARSPRPVQRNPMAPKSPKEFTTDIAERAAKPIPMSGGIGTVLDQSRTLEIPPTFPTPLDEGGETISDIQQRENLAGHTRDRWETLKAQSRDYNQSARQRKEAVKSSQEALTSSQQRLAATADSLKNVEQALMNTTDPEVRKILERTRDQLTAVIKPPK